MDFIKENWDITIFIIEIVLGFKLIVNRYLAILYGVFFCSILYNGLSLMSFLYVLVVILLCGFFYINSSSEFNFEKELGTWKLYQYLTKHLLFKANIQVFICCLIVSTIANYIINLKVIYLFEYGDKSILGVIILFYLYHIVKNYSDSFDVYTFEYIKHKIHTTNTSYKKNINLELLAFIIYMEDKNLFIRKKVSYGYFDIKVAFRRILTRLKEKYLYRKQGKELLVNDRLVNRFTRGYSTLEQQVIRNIALKPNSYRYKYRRKLFVERIYNEAFAIAWCNFKSRQYKKSDRRNAKKQLIFSLKYQYLRYYYFVILNEPQNITELIENMQSRVEKDLYKKIYEVYIKEGHNKEYKECISRISQLEKKYSILNN